jgi:LmbE family N-acetylglucosaminyl deacetylase
MPKRFSRPELFTKLSECFCHETDIFVQQFDRVRLDCMFLWYSGNTGCTFYGVPDHGSCHGMSRRMQAFFVVQNYVGDSKSVLYNLLQSAGSTWRRREPLRWQYRKAATDVSQSLTGGDSNNGDSGNCCASSVQCNCNSEFYAAEVWGQFRR